MPRPFPSGHGRRKRPDRRRRSRSPAWHCRRPRPPAPPGARVISSEDRALRAWGRLRVRRSTPPAGGEQQGAGKRSWTDNVVCREEAEQCRHNPAPVRISPCPVCRPDCHSRAKRSRAAAQSEAIRLRCSAMAFSRDLRFSGIIAARASCAFIPGDHAVRGTIRLGSVLLSCLPRPYALPIAPLCQSQAGGERESWQVCRCTAPKNGARQCGHVLEPRRRQSNSDRLYDQYLPGRGARRPANPMQFALSTGCDRLVASRLAAHVHAHGRFGRRSQARNG